ncbi:MAG: GTPase-activating protein [Geobacteraceae bacterium GWC2_55_20]|nr:MAG: GTPase-activating protein [Geobacteraceae bacterium GWC2_55_20]OGU22091.1 MAG: GTPase-activating protein [Geobacteraceae bacterium GWF2_54_21]HBA72351.1 GTPase-activating protein [Geobacter sp.]HCE67422.1 GTPase-activating protein [Geobacter sp.]
MFLLPKGNPLFENLAVTKLKLPDVLLKLSTGGFTGYSSFVFQTSTVILVFEAGKLVSALLEDRNGKRQNGFEALSALAELMVSSGSGTMNVYKLSKDLTMCIHALLEGETLYKAQELKLIDINSLLGKVKNDRMNGCLRIYTEEHSAMIFYKEGNPLGFFHDGSGDIESSSSESQKIAGLPGAKIDLFATQSVEEIMGINLLEVANIQKIWDATVALHQSEIDRTNKERQERDIKAATLRLAELEEQVKVIVGEYVGKVGRGIVDKELSENGGNSCLIDEAGFAKFLSGVERAAKLLISGTNIKAMMEKLTSTITIAKSDS